MITFKINAEILNLHAKWLICVIFLWPSIGQRMLKCVLNNHSSKDWNLKLNQLVRLCIDRHFPFLTSSQFFLHCCLLCWWFSFFSLYLSRSFIIIFISAAGFIESLFPAPAQFSPPCLVYHAFILCLAHSDSHTQAPWCTVRFFCHPHCPPWAPFPFIQLASRCYCYGQNKTKAVCTSCLSVWRMGQGGCLVTFFPPTVRIPSLTHQNCPRFIKHKA